MSETSRMLLSHNCALPEGLVKVLSRADFVTVFAESLQSYPDIQCRPIENPHWVVEIIFDGQQQTPIGIAELCAQSLSSCRSAEQPKNPEHHTVMLLGGMKTTPAAGASPTSLQPGEWGVDVVETLSPEQFLVEMNWDTVIKDKPSEQIFKVTHGVE